MSRALRRACVAAFEDRVLKDFQTLLEYQVQLLGGASVRRFFDLQVSVPRRIVAEAAKDLLGAANPLADATKLRRTRERVVDQEFADGAIKRRDVLFGCWLLLE